MLGTRVFVGDANLEGFPDTDRAIIMLGKNVRHVIAIFIGNEGNVKVFLKDGFNKGLISI